MPEKIERLIRCEASAYQKLLMKRVEENLGSIGNAKVLFQIFFLYDILAWFLHAIMRWFSRADKNSGSFSAQHCDGDA